MNDWKQIIKNATIAALENDSADILLKACSDNNLDITSKPVQRIIIEAEQKYIEAAEHIYRTAKILLDRMQCN